MIFLQKLDYKLDLYYSKDEKNMYIKCYYLNMNGSFALVYLC